jgi:Tol biopolymer transport system component
MKLSVFLLLFLTISSSYVFAGETERVSVDSGGIESDDWSQCPGVSANGRFIVFESTATNLVPDDTNGTFDIFVHDRLTGLTERVSVASDESQSNATSYSSNDHGPDISADGRFVVFYSYASNLVAGDTNGLGDIFVRDRQSGTTIRVSVASDGSEGDGYSYEPAISADGNFVVFQSFASNLVAGDTNSVGDIFVRDLTAETTERVNVAADGSEGDDNSYNGRISADGRLIVFSSLATNLVAGDTNTYRDVFVRDRQTGMTERVSVASNGSEANNWSVFPRISANGRYVVFASPASNLVTGDTNGQYDIFLHDRDVGTTERVSRASDGTQTNWFSYRADVSGDGRLVAFHSAATNLVEDDTNDLEDIFIRDRETGVTERASVASDGIQSDGRSLFPSISSDGRYVSFHSIAGNLVGNDTNAEWDVFVHEVQTPIFRDGFETGDTTGWTEVVIGG